MPVLQQINLHAPTQSWHGRPAHVLEKRGRAARATSFNRKFVARASCPVLRSHFEDTGKMPVLLHQALQYFSLTIRPTARAGYINWLAAKSHANFTPQDIDAVAVQPIRADQSFAICSIG